LPYQNPERLVVVSARDVKHGFGDEIHIAVIDSSLRVPCQIVRTTLPKGRPSTR
jgi:hypothetical protein